MVVVYMYVSQVLLTQEFAEKSVQSLLTGCGIPPSTWLVSGHIQYGEFSAIPRASNSYSFDVLVSTALI